MRRLLFALFLLPALALADFPPPELLEELRARITRPDPCHPRCAAIQELQLRLGKEEWRMRFEVHADAPTAIPLPAREGQWWPNEVDVTRTGEEGQGAGFENLHRGEDGTLWLLADEGLSTIDLEGPAPARSQVDLPLPLLPGRVIDAFDGRDWAVNGVNPDGVATGQLQLIRKQLESAAGEAKTLEPGVLPPLLKVTRTLHFGLEWTVATQVRRLSPAGSPVTFQLPLIAGEAVSTPGYEVTRGQVEVRLGAGQSQVQFSSRLDPVQSIRLTAPSDERWSELWRLDIGPVWHLEYEGLPVIHHQDGRGAWLPAFSPYPGESVDISISRPEGVPGNVVTIDRSKLLVAPGQRATDATLTIDLRASQGGQHPIELPENAVLRKVAIDGKTQPVRQEGNIVPLPIKPVAQRFEIEWREEAGVTGRFETPRVDLGIPSVNHAITVELGKDRWTLFAFGPLLGPAVLFWSVMLVVVILSLGLGRATLTPLKWYHWLLLGIGLTQSGIVGAVLIVGWLLALGVREKMAQIGRPFSHNLLQIVTLLLTLAALSSLFEAVSRGLLGFPAMQITGNGSNAYQLNWYQDQVARTPPQATILSVPLLFYRIAMLAWALWLAFALLRWLKWGWAVFSRDALWRQSDWKLSDTWKGKHEAGKPKQAGDGSREKTPGLDDDRPGPKPENK